MTLRYVLGRDDFPARWHCGNWSGAHGWTHIVSDLATFAAYFAIPLVLLYYMRKRKDLPFAHMMPIFAVFILSCGTGHLLDALIFWYPVYRVSAAVKVTTAVVSWLAVAALWDLTPKLLQYPSPEALRVEVASRRLAMQQLQEKTLELEKSHADLERYARLLSEDVLVRSAFEVTPFGKLIVNPEGRILMTNPALNEMFGYQSDELLDQSVNVLIPEADAEHHHKRVESFFQDPPREKQYKMGIGRELSGLRKDGTTIPLAVGLTSLDTKQGRLVLAHVADTTEQQRSEEFIRVLFEKASDAHFLLDDSGILECNTAALNLFGCATKSELLGRYPTDFLPECQPDGSTSREWLKRLQTEARAHGHYQAEFTVLSREQGALTCDISLTAVRISGREAFLVACHDISLQKQQQEKLKARHDEMKELLYVVSHDLKSPLVTINGFVGLMVSNLKKGRHEKVLDSAERIRRGAQTMERLIDDILALSRVQRHQATRKAIRVEEVVQEVLESLASDIEKSQAKVVVEAPLPPLVNDEGMLRQILLNLVQNGLRYGCPEPGMELVIGGHRVSGKIHLFVKDSGPGIPNQFHQQIFRLFQRLDKEHQGTGLGLAAVTKAVEKMDGRVRLESEPGQGATFWLEFPERGTAV